MFRKQWKVCFDGDTHGSGVPGPPTAGPPLLGLLPKGGREPCASPRDCDKHYTEAINV